MNEQTETIAPPPFDECARTFNRLQADEYKLAISKLGSDATVNSVQEFVEQHRAPFMTERGDRARN